MSSISAEQRIHILGQSVDASLSPTVSIPSGFLATEHWVDLVDATENNGRVHGYVVGIDKEDGVPVLSARQQAEAGIVDEDGKEVEPASLRVPRFPFGLLRSRQIKKAALVYTHRVPNSEDYPPTTTFSDEDISQFFGSDYAAMLMLDKGGAHLIAKKERFARDAWGMPHPKLVETTADDVLEGSRSMRDVLNRVAYQLSVHGVGYYYTPDLLQPNDSVEFQNLRHAEAILKPSDS